MHAHTSNFARVIGLEGGFGIKSEFRDRHELRGYVRALLLAKRLLDDPGLVARGRAYLDRFVRIDPRQSSIYQLWTEALSVPVRDLVSQLLADDERGAYLRETAPVFVVIPPDEVTGAVRRAA